MLEQINIISLEQSFGYGTAKGDGIMLHREIEVLNKIRGSKDPELAMQLVMKITLDFLTQLESSQTEPAAPQQEFCVAV